MASIIKNDTLKRHHKISLKKLNPVNFYLCGRGTHLKQFINGFPVSGGGGNLQLRFKKIVRKLSATISIWAMDINI